MPSKENLKNGSLPFEFYLFIAGALLSTTGTFMQILAEGYLVAELTSEPFWAGFVGFCGGVPLLSLMIVGGAIADRMDRRKLFLVSQLFLMLVAILLSVVSKLGIVELWHVAVLAFFTGVGSALAFPAYQGFLFDIAGKHAVAKAVSWNAIQLHISRMLGPMLAGLLIAYMGAWGCFSINAASFLAVLIVTSIVPVREVQTPQRGNFSDFLRSFRQAFRYVGKEPRIKLALLLTALTTVLLIPHMNLSPLYVKFVLGAGPKALGRLWGVSAIGSLIVNFIYAKFSLRLEERNPSILVGSSLLAAFSLAGLSVATDLWLIHFLFLCLGAFIALCVVTSQSIIQHDVNSAYRGRVFGIWGTCFQGMFPIGSFFVGTLAQFITIPGAWFVASVMLVLGVVFFRYRFR